MTPEEQDILLEIKDCLVEVLAEIKKVYGHSAYYQHIEYKADNDRYENWLFRARGAILKVEELLDLPPIN